MTGSAQGPLVIQWILDTRPLWPKATLTPQLENEASRALALLSQEERIKVLKYYHVRDAKMAMASHLLKRYLLSRYGRVPWPEVKISKDERTQKPIFRDPSCGQCSIGFNVSHQAGLVALSAVCGRAERDSKDQTRGGAGSGRGDGQAADVGVDIVCTSERRVRDHQMVREEGWPAFVDMHADVLADSEASYLKYQILSAVPGLPHSASQDEILDFKLRCFYTLWCLREAYLKMTGDALVADWVRGLEFRRFMPPAPTMSLDVPAEEGPTGQVISRHNIFVEGQPVTNVNMSLQGLGPDYIVCTAIRTRSSPSTALNLRIGSFEMVSIDDILNYAESTL
ncbi:hypothetical protein VTK73DRAFT_2748 [Phialemonium thermophilum]|uniref:holo-[acyl-carrier-protein] synthase n=1 Tax=Phialemonium thermophilum TaxID=223376 RepID=A0ABR3Y2Q3_9PEZI